MEDSLSPFLDAARRRCIADLLPATRVHLVNGFFPTSHSIYIKREDEAGYALPGGKKRKMASILPVWIADGIRRVYIIGGANSNNTLAVASLLLGNGMEPVLLTPDFRQETGAGNSLLGKILLAEAQILRISRDKWQNIEEIASEYVQKDMGQGIRAAWLPEGAMTGAALAGAATLMADILRNEQETGCVFEQIVMDAGTGMTAMGLLSANALLASPKAVHIVQMADSPEAFRANFARMLEDAGLPAAPDVDAALAHAHFHFPATGRSFGAVNATVLGAIVEIARTTGIFTDSVYTAKLFLTLQKILPTLPSQSPLLLIHSGGANSLHGFSEKLQKFL